MAAFTVIDPTETTAATTTAWEKTSIPSSYDHLLLVVSARTDYGGYYVFPKLIFNGDTGTNYSDTELRTITVGNTVTSARNTANAYIQAGTVNGDNAEADCFGVWKGWIPNYANTVGYKSILMESTAGGDVATHATFNINITSGLWHSTAAIDAIKMTAFSASFLTYSTFTLYGVTGA